MSTSATPIEQRLGYFGPFMAAWGKATPETRERVYSDALAYWRGDLSASAEVSDVSAALGIPVPPASP